MKNISKNIGNDVNDLKDFPEIDKVKTFIDMAKVVREGYVMLKSRNTNWRPFVKLDVGEDKETESGMWALPKFADFFRGKEKIIEYDSWMDCSIKATLMICLYFWD